MAASFNPKTIHFHNTYTTNERSLLVPVAEQSVLIDIAKQQTAKWSPNTILAQTAPVPIDGADATAQPLAQPNLDIDSTHIITTESTVYNIDITETAKIHQEETNQTSGVGKADQMSDEPNSKSQPTQTQLDHFNSHPIFTLLSNHDTNYIQSLSQQLATHQSSLDYNQFNAYTSQHSQEPYDLDQLQLILHAAQTKTAHDQRHALQQPQKEEEGVARRVKNPFPQALSLFQSHGVAAILHNHHLLVTAHTGSGKTMAAHALIINTLARGGKVVYTTPIKALSNQKFAELSEIYPDVGLQTGDVAVNPNARVIVMTTEILRNMSLHAISPYQAAIFDEVHYMDDASRGVIWEETLLTLPLSTQMVFLSASVENGDEFAQWISKVTKRPCHIVNTRVRAVPIAHILLKPVKLLRTQQTALFNSYKQNKILRDGEDSHSQLLFAPDTAYQQSEYHYHIDFPPIDPGAEAQKEFSSPPAVHILPQIVAALITAITNNWLPLISFSFARRDLDLFATEVYSLGFCVTTPAQQLEIGTFCEENFPRDIPNREATIKQLKSGIGVHHSGQITRVREVIEMLLEKSLIKILFASETFSVGINVPVRSVMFTTLCKFDGSERRLVNPSEYTQMSGRAGRRGMDRVGVSIVIEDRDLSPAMYQNVVCGGSLCIESRFRVSIGLLLSSFTAGTSGDNNKSSTINSRHSNTTQSTSQMTPTVTDELMQRNIGGEHNGYTLQQVIENSFAIYRFSTNKGSVASAMLTRALLLFAQLIDKLYRSTRKSPHQLDRFLPWIDVEAAYNEIGVEMMTEISTMKLATFSILSLALGDNGCLALNSTINLRTIAAQLITPPILFPLYLQSLYLIASQNQIPISTQTGEVKLQHNNSINQLLRQGKSSNLYASHDIYHTIFSILHPWTDNVLSFKPIASQDSNESIILTTTPSTAQPRPHTFEYGSPLDNIEVPTPSSASTIHLMNQQGDPNDVVSYCVPGRVVYIDFPPEFHSVDHHTRRSKQFTDIVQGLGTISIPNTIGWGVVVGIKMQYTTSILVDVLVALPTTLGKHELHVISVCECAISRISTITLSIPHQTNLETDAALLALWLGLRQSSDAWLASVSSTHTPGQYQLPLGLEACTDVNTFPDLLLHSDTKSFVDGSKTKFPLIFSRTTIPTASHNEVQHRSICTLIPPPKRGNKSDETTNLPSTTTAVSATLSSQSLLFHHTGSYLAGILTSCLATYPPPLRTMINLLLDAQACWVSNKIDSYQHILELATTSYNNTASTERKGHQDDDDNYNDDFHEASGNTSQEQQQQLHLELAQTQDKRKSSIQSIVSKYLSTLSTMTKYMAKKGYIRPHQRSHHDSKTGDDCLNDLMNSTTRDITELLSNFTTEDKGRVCSYLDSPNSIVLTELLFDNAFKELSPAELAAVCSIFVTSARETDKNAAGFPTNVSTMYQRILQECQVLDGLSEEFNGSITTPASRSSGVQPTASLLYDTRELGLEMVNPVLKWCETHNIDEALKSAATPGVIFPGNLARTLSRILNLLEQLTNAAKDIGYDELVDKFAKTETVIKKGTLFVSSLHLLNIQLKRQEDLGAKK